MANITFYQFPLNFSLTHFFFLRFFTKYFYIFIHILQTFFCSFLVQISKIFLRFHFSCLFIFLFHKSLFLHGPPSFHQVIQPLKYLFYQKLYPSLNILNPNNQFLNYFSHFQIIFTFE